MLEIPQQQVQQYVGHEAGDLPWFTIDQARINQFADCTLDHQFIHVDPEKAKQTPFGSTIAHGFLTLSLLSHLLSEWQLRIEGVHTAINAGFDTVRFLQPVKVDSRVRANCKILAIDDSVPGRYTLTIAVNVDIENETKPALYAEWKLIQLV